MNNSIGEESATNNKFYEERLRMGRLRLQMQLIDKVMDIRPPIPCDHAEVSVSSSSCTENTREDPTDAGRSGLNEPRKLKDTDTEEESR